MMVTLFSLSEGPAWIYPVDDFVAAINAAAAAVDAPPSEAPPRP
jgi:hypothetical protein